MFRIAALAVLLALAPAAAPPSRIETPPQRAYSAFSPDRAHRFDFWIGEWEVNLRMLQDDLTFEDSVAARASVYSILDGKAILELWDSVPIKGFSLRYYDPAARKWELWLDWPQPNFRPIMMTAITTIGGMIPLALAGSNSRPTLARA